jgi:hypothetical protein
MRLRRERAGGANVVRTTLSRRLQNIDHRAVRRPGYTVRVPIGGDRRSQGGLTVSGNVLPETIGHQASSDGDKTPGQDAGREHGRSGSRASRHPTSPRQARAGVNLPSWEEEAVGHRLALADRAGRLKRIRRAKTLRISRFILHAALIRWPGPVRDCKSFQQFVARMSQRVARMRAQRRAQLRSHSDDRLRDIRDSSNTAPDIASLIRATSPPRWLITPNGRRVDPERVGRASMAAVRGRGNPRRIGPPPLLPAHRG